jgi:hypothetical protein
VPGEASLDTASMFSSRSGNLNCVSRQIQCKYTVHICLYVKVKAPAVPCICRGLAMIDLLRATYGQQMQVSSDYTLPWIRGWPAPGKMANMRNLYRCAIDGPTLL